jgi:hypothetical protein
MCHSLYVSDDCAVSPVLCLYLLCISLRLFVPAASWQGSNSRSPVEKQLTPLGRLVLQDFPSHSHGIMIVAM